jgi:UDP-glucose 4-epimerase
LVTVLIAGGAGYVGGHIVRALLAAEYPVVVLDNLSGGHAQAVRVAEALSGRSKAVGAALEVGDLLDPVFLHSVFTRHRPRVVVHLAAECSVPESMSRPAAYYRTNLVGGLVLLDVMLAHGVRDIVFSSTAAVYGEPASVPIREEHPLLPVNVYGETKLAFERVLKGYGTAYGLRYTIFRYFNAAGADSAGSLGEDHRPELHLLPRILRVALGQEKSFTVCGADYPTADGTCVRDFVHVEDIAAAHLVALEALPAGASGRIYNLGSGRGHSLLEVVRVVERVTGLPVRTDVGPRRLGDPSILVADPEKAYRELRWRAWRSHLDDIVRTAWAWHVGSPEGYAPDCSR